MRSCAKFVERLEKRQLLSAAFNAPLDLESYYGGFYTIGSSSGTATLSIQTVQKKTFSGELICAFADGTIVSGPIKGTVSKPKHPHDPVPLSFKLSVKGTHKTTLTFQGEYISRDSIVVTKETGIFSNEKIRHSSTITLGQGVEV